jgi:hypothetical protein
MRVGDDHATCHSAFAPRAGTRLSRAIGPFQYPLQAIIAGKEQMTTGRLGPSAG